MRSHGTRARSHAHGRFQRRAVVHLSIGVLLITALSFAVVRPSSSATGSMAMEGPPPVVFSGLAGRVPMQATSYLQAGGSHTTHESIQRLTLRPTASGATMIMRTADAVSPAASFSSGVAAAAASSGEASSGVQPLADLIDPQKPYALYQTRPGDTIATIAAQYGVEVHTILDNNPEVADGSLILIGQHLLIPRADGILYTVGHGETLEDILGQYDNVTAEDVLAFRPNNIIDPAGIETGRQVLLPGATLKPPPPPPPPPPTPAPLPTPASPPVSSGDDGGGFVDGGGGAAFVSPAPSSGGRFGYPLNGWNGVSDPFGTGRGAGRIHTGIDLDLYGYWGSPIFSACNGVVTRTEYLTYSYGYHVVIDCGDGWSTLYAHLSEIHVSPGQSVGMGEQIGVSGLTGYTTGEHLHFEILFGGSPVNPADYLGF